MSVPPPASIVVTGASGFVGRALMASPGFLATPLGMASNDWRERASRVPWGGATVVHLAARVHEVAPQQPAHFQRDNVDKTRELAAMAIAGGARRLVFLSSIKVHGEETVDRPFAATDAPAPCDAYAQSKWQAEQALQECATRTGLEVVVVRTPLVVGPGAAGNLRALVALADSPWPLPFAAIANRRTWIGIDDLVDLLRVCIGHPAAPGGIFLAGAPEPISTPRIVATLRRALGRPERLFAVAPARLEALAAAAGWRERMRRLTRSLEVDVSQTAQVLGWTARTAVESAVAGLARAA